MDLKQQRKAACDKAESLVSFAESARRPLSATENTHYQEAMAEYSNGKKVSESLLEHADPLGGYPLVSLGATLYEGSNTGGGYAVPIVVDRSQPRRGIVVY